jgi:hypothetical protein
VATLLFDWSRCSNGEQGEQQCVELQPTVDAQPATGAVRGGQQAEDGAAEFQPEDDSVRCRAVSQMGQAEMAVAGIATKTMEGRAPVGVFEPEELDGIGRHMDQRGLMLGGAVAHRVAAQMGMVSTHGWQSGRTDRQSGGRTD